MKERTKRIMHRFSTSIILAQLMSVTAFASRIEDSDLGRGTAALINDVSKFLLIYGPIACGVVAAIFLVRKSMADEQDGKMWQKRITGAIISGVGIGLVSGVINLISAYYV